MRRMSENVRASSSRNPQGLHGLYRDNFTFFYVYTTETWLGGEDWNNLAHYTIKFTTFVNTATNHEDSWQPSVNRFLENVGDSSSQPFGPPQPVIFGVIWAVVHRQERCQFTASVNSSTLVHQGRTERDICRVVALPSCDRFNLYHLYGKPCQ
jgi:hypothetical protein